MSRLVPSALILAAALVGCEGGPTIVEPSENER